MFCVQGGVYGGSGAEMRVTVVQKKGGVVGAGEGGVGSGLLFRVIQTLL